MYVYFAILLYGHSGNAEMRNQYEVNSCWNIWVNVDLIWGRSHVLDCWLTGWLGGWLGGWVGEWVGRWGGVGWVHHTRPVNNNAHEHTQLHGRTMAGPDAGHTHRQ